MRWRIVYKQRPYTSERDVLSGNSLNLWEAAPGEDVLRVDMDGQAYWAHDYYWMTVGGLFMSGNEKPNAGSIKFGRYTNDREMADVREMEPAIPHWEVVDPLKVY